MKLLEKFAYSRVAGREFGICCRPFEFKSRCFREFPQLLGREFLDNFPLDPEKVKFSKVSGQREGSVFSSVLIATNFLRFSGKLERVVIRVWDISSSSKLPGRAAQFNIANSEPLRFRTRRLGGQSRTWSRDQK